ncbi:hypothetical protein [Caulobacter sp. 1776]|uniref:hypothetical protein n=1 Tax=Caulobacter sp. 1776 TaxID=3156420 RepID=UPI00339A1035
MTGASIVCDFDEREVECGDAEWHDLPFGVRLLIRPQTGLLSATVEAQIARDLYLLQMGEDVLERYGFSPDEVGLLADKDVSMGFAMMVRATARGLALIEDWNLVDKDGVTIELTAEKVRKFFHLGPVKGSGPVLMAAFSRIIDTPAQIRAAEGNGSGSSLNGATAAGPNTAQTAGTPERPAPSADAAVDSSARKSSTPRKRRKA